MISSSGTNHKIIGRTRNSFQFRRNKMVISIIAILLFARGVFSSLLVHGLISTIDDDTTSINLHANKSSVSNNLLLIKKWRTANAKLRIHLDLEEKIIEIINGTDRKQDCFEFKKLNFFQCDKKLIHQDSIQHKDLRCFVIPQRYQNSINLDQELEYYMLSQILSNVELVLERKRLNLRNELLFKYIKIVSIQDSLSWLTRLFAVKLHDDFDDSFRERLLYLLKQAEFLLEYLIKENQPQHTEKSKDNFSSDESKNDIANDEEIKIKKVTTLNKEGLKNFPDKPDKTEIEKLKNKIQRTNKNIMDDKVETRIMNYPQLKNISSNNFKNKSSTVKNINNFTNQNFIMNKSTETKYKYKTDMDNREISKMNTFTRIPHGKSLATSFEDHRNRSNEVKKVYAILSGTNITSTVKKIEKEKQDQTHVIFDRYSRKNVDKPKIASQRTLQDIVHPDENNNKKQKFRYVSRKEMESNSHEGEKTKILINEILKAVNEVLPPENLTEVGSKRLKKTIPRMS
ncbi:uncharacterized protein [Anoplolepis gracilipes]|uniref:uncharacterized protein n=1 Tax=Anoplolepis gracilipes TaxID=354296 RepID=UPI003B9E4753